VAVVRMPILMGPLAPAEGALPVVLVLVPDVAPLVAPPVVLPVVVPPDVEPAPGRPVVLPPVPLVPLVVGSRPPVPVVPPSVGTVVGWPPSPSWTAGPVELTCTVEPHAVSARADAQTAASREARRSWEGMGRE